VRFLFQKNLHQHRIHQHNIHKHNLHVVKVHEPIIHLYHKSQQKVIPIVQEVTKVIPVKEVQHQVHEYQQKAAPVVLEHKGWSAPSGGWGEGGGAAPVAPVAAGGWGEPAPISGGEGWRRSDDLPEESLILVKGETSPLV